MRVAAYCRVSTDTSDQINSLEAQKNFFTEYTNKNGHTLVDLYADEGKSGTKLKQRKDFLRLMNDAKKGIFDIVVVKDISRFARNTVDFLQSIRSLKSLNIEVIFITSNQTVLGNSEFALTIFGALAQEESANTSKRVKFGKRLNAEKGRIPNLMFGYDKIPGDYFNLAINQKEADIVKTIFNMYVEDMLGENRIALYLNNKGFTAKRGGKWTQNTVNRILSNEIYIGTVINGKEEIDDFLLSSRKKRDESEWLITYNPSLQIVDADVFKTAQRLRNEKSSTNFARTNRSYKNLFSSIVKCKECGSSFRKFSKTYKNLKVKWICSGRNIHGVGYCSNSISLNEEDLVNTIRAYFMTILSERDNVVDLITNQILKRYKLVGDNNDYLSTLKTQYSKLLKTKQKYLNMYEDDFITREEMRDKISSIKVELDSTENKIKILEGDTNTTKHMSNSIESMFSTIEEIASFQTLTNEMLKKVIDRIEIDKSGTIDIFLRAFQETGIDETFLVFDNHTYGCIKTERLFVITK